MKRLFVIFAWTLCFLGLLLAVDQVFVHVPLSSPGLHTVQSCYLDFRQRLLHLGAPPATPPRVATPAPAPAHPASPPTSVESAIGRSEAPAAKAPAASPRYVYVDANGQLQFAASRAEIPPAFRKGAQRLGH